MNNNFYNFSNGVTIDSVPQYLINARVEEEIFEEYGIKYATPTFVGTPEEEATIKKIECQFSQPPIIIGSIVAAQAYPGKVYGMCPVPGYERVAPADKLMRVDKFTRY